MKHAVNVMAGELAGTAYGAEDANKAARLRDRLRSILAEVVGVDQVSDDDHFFDAIGADSMVMARFCARLRKHTDLPSVSMREVYANPTIRGLAAAIAVPTVSPAPELDRDPRPSQANQLEAALREILVEVLKVEQLGLADDFFRDLGADSMVMARFCARLRKRTDLPTIAMKDVYANPSVRALAAAFANAPAEAVVPTQTTSTDQSPPHEAAAPIATWRYVLCGVLQFATGFAFVAVGADVIIRALAWMLVGSTYLDTYFRSLLITTTLLLVAIALPIAAKWLLIGHWTPRKIRIWSLDYYRFWLVRSLVQTNPLVLFPTPIYAMYLRLLGAKIGRNVLFASHRVPVCADLLSVGDNALIRKDSFILCYRAVSGWIETGPVTIGKDAVVGEMTVLDIDTTIGDGSQIGHASSLHAGQTIPPGEHWHGSPARKTDVDYADVEPRKCGLLRKTVYCLSTLVPSFFIAPAIIAVFVHIIVWLAGRHYFTASEIPAHAHVEFYWDALIASTALFVLSTVMGLVSVLTIPRLLNLAIRPNKTYPLYGFHDWAQRRIAGLTNIKFFLYLFGDSSYIVYYLQAIGYDLSKVVQTGSNFGMDLKHDNPFLVTVGSGTMVADGLSSINTDYSSTSFRSARVVIGANNFVGNQVAYPSRGKTGDNCLLGTKVMVPVEGPVREDIGLLGSPSFDIPRTVRRDGQISKQVTGDELKRRMSRKNRHNLGTMGLFLTVHWIQSAVMLLIAFVAVDLFAVLGSFVVAAVMVVALPLRVGVFVLVDRTSTHFRSLQPRTCSIYDPYFWFHERHWKLMATSSQVRAFDGTPLKGLIWRLLGIRMGRRLFDDGCGILERTLVSIGDDCTLNQGSIIQPHSQEDAGFKSDRIAIGNNCTLDVGSWVHYGAVMGDGSQLTPNAFLMKGEQVPPFTRWAENPAREIGPARPVHAQTAAVAQSHRHAISTSTLANGVRAQ
jgi:non-ribosomal peptide synthetase-like protein